MHHYHKKLRLSVLLACASITLTTHVNATNYVVDTATVVTNGGAGNVLDGDDSLLITQTGSITTVGTEAVLPTGNNNTIINNGALNTTNNRVIQLVGTSNNTVYNNGTIVGVNGRGINATGDNHRVTNNGSITTSGTNATAGTIQNGGSFTNNGSISTSGNNNLGILGFGGASRVLNTGSITTSGSSAIGISTQGASDILTNSGSITTTGTNSHGIVSTSFGSSAILINSGIITTSGTNANGMISFGTSDILNNTGIITTSGPGGNGMASVGTSNILNNTGIITTSGDFGSGMSLFGSSETALNTGRITTTGDNSYGFEASGTGEVLSNQGSIQTTGNTSRGVTVTGTNNIATNIGSITTSGTFGVGMSVIAADNNTLVNTGLITTSGSNGYGLESTGSNNTIINSGTVITTGPLAVGVRSAGGNNNNISISGEVISAQSNSILLATNDTLNLLAPAFLGGLIDLGTNTTLNIVTGPSHSVLWNFSTGTMAAGSPHISGTVPFFYDPATQQFATFDPTIFAGLYDELADISGSVSLVIQSRLDNTCCARNGLWLSTFGSTYKYGGNASLLDYRYQYWGIVGGFDKQFCNDITLGILAGYGRGFFNNSSIFTRSFDNDGEGAIVAVYGGLNSGIFFVDIDLACGTLSHAQSRFVNDNLAPLGVAFAKASYDSIWFSPEVAVGANILNLQNWKISPILRGRFAIEDFDGYTESGISANATAADYTIQMSEWRAELAAQRSFGYGCLSGRIGFLQRNRMAGNNTVITIFGQSAGIPSFYKQRNAGYLGLDARFFLAKEFMLDLDGELTKGNGIRGMRGEVSLTKSF